MTSAVANWKHRLWTFLTAAFPFTWKSHEPDLLCGSWSTIHDESPRETVTVDQLPNILEEFSRAVSQENKLSDVVHSPNSEEICQPDWHIRQWFDEWDCGIACLQMVLRWLRTNETSDTHHATIHMQGITTNNSQLSEAEIQEREWLVEAVQTKSVWTVDLFLAWHVLSQRVTIPPHQCMFLSKNLSINEQWASLNYYQSHFDDDKQRLAQRFEQLSRITQNPTNTTTNTTTTTTIASQSHQVQDFPIQLLIQIVTKTNCIAIVLVDNSILRHQQYSDDEHIDDTYTGHYIVIISYSHTTDAFLCLDPGRNDTLVSYAVDSLERAWRALGTDQDILLFSRHFSITNS